MDKSIVTALMMTVAVICALVLFKAVYPAIVRGGDAMISAEARVSKRLKTQVEIIHAAGELDGDGNWQDVNGDDDFDAFFWVKNVGSITISAVDSCDLFFGQEGNFARIPYESEAGGSYPYWTWEMENGSRWEPTRTLKISVHHLVTLSSGRYFVKIVTPEGVADEAFFSM